MNAAAFGIDDCNCLTLRGAARRISHHYDRRLAPTGLRVTQFALLATCADGAGPTVNGLARALDLDRTTMGKNLRPLVRAGLVQMDANPSDRRERRVRLTARGLAILRQAIPLWQEAQHEFEAANGAARARDLRSTLKHLQIGSPDGCEDAWADDAEAL